MTRSFADIGIGEIRFDCRHYNGYKPCGRGDFCPGCGDFSPRGEEILIIKLGAMGDVLRSKSLLPGLKKAFPTSRITWLTNPGSEALVRDPLVDEIRTLSVEGTLALEGRHFARLLCLDKDPHALALSKKLDAKVRLGFAPSEHNTVSVWNEGSEYALRLGLSDDLKYRHNTLSVPQILYGMAELTYEGQDYALAVSESARTTARAILAQAGVDPSKRLVGINTGCGPVFATKAWTAEGYGELIDRLRDVQVLLLGGPREESLHAHLLRGRAQRAVFDSGTDNPLEVFFALVGACDAVLSADTMAMHIAIALRRPVVAFFGPTCHQEVDLFGRGEKIVTDFPCSPCYLKTCDKTPTCMQALPASQVEAALRRVLPTPT